GLALGAAVLTGSVGTLLEVLRRLGRERDTESAGETDLAAVLGLRGHAGAFHYMAAAIAAHERASPHHSGSARTSGRSGSNTGVGCVRHPVEPGYFTRDCAYRWR